MPKNLRELIESRMMFCSEVAEKSGVSPGHLSDILAGNRRCGIAFARALGKAFPDLSAPDLWKLALAHWKPKKRT